MNTMKKNFIRGTTMLAQLVMLFSLFTNYAAAAVVFGPQSDFDRTYTMNAQDEQNFDGAPYTGNHLKNVSLWITGANGNNSPYDCYDTMFGLRVFDSNGNPYESYEMNSLDHLGFGGALLGGDQTAWHFHNNVVPVSDIRSFQIFPDPASTNQSCLDSFAAGNYQLVQSANSTIPYVQVEGYDF